MEYFGLILIVSWTRYLVKPTYDLDKLHILSENLIFWYLVNIKGKNPMKKHLFSKIKSDMNVLYKF